MVRVRISVLVNTRSVTAISSAKGLVNTNKFVFLRQLTNRETATSFAIIGAKLIQLHS